MIEPLRWGFDGLADHVVITDPNANIIYANKAVEKNTGFSVYEAIGRNPGDLWGGQMPKEFYEKMWQTIKVEKRPFVGEVRNKRKDGTTYWQEIHISPVLWESGAVKFFIGIEPNITERKEKEKFREEFVSILAHQLQNPLASVKWTLDWLSGQGNLTDEQKEAMRGIYRRNESLIHLIGDLLIFSRIGAVTPLPERFDLVAEIERIADDVGRKNPRVSFAFEKEGDVSLLANKSFVTEIFYNLISNAAEYADKTAGKVDIHFRNDGQHCLVAVKNNGTSIPPEDQPKIFSKFFRASNAGMAKETGTGLGLFIVKMICDSLGWDVWFQSPLSDGSGGTVFFIKIPFSSYG